MKPTIFKTIEDLQEAINLGYIDKKAFNFTNCQYIFPALVWMTKSITNYNSLSDSIWFDEDYKHLPAEAVKWSEIKNTFKTIHEDWRLPVIQELLTLVDYTKIDPASKLKDFSSSYYWSSTTNADSTYSAWIVGFRSGYSGNGSKGSSYYVRCVRNTKYGLEWSHSSIDMMTWNEAIKYASELKAPTYYKEKNSDE